MDKLVHEKALLSCGYHFIAGVDEAGRGALAGPLVVAAVVFPLDYFHPLINDSKQLTSKQRNTLYSIILEAALEYKIVVVSQADIDEYNVYKATQQGMVKAINGLTRCDAVLVDAMPLPQITKKVVSIIKGDQVSISIAAASILAKVTRDKIMEDYHHHYPHYGFNHHKGYGTKQHQQAIIQFGISPIHRVSFEPIKSLLRPKLDL